MKAVVDVDEADTVTVPDTNIPLQSHEIAILKTIVDPLDECDDMGVGFYATVKEFVDFCLTQNI